jgi:hypothetical protein
VPTKVLLRKQLRRQVIIIIIIIFSAHHASYHKMPPDVKEFTLLIARVTLGDPCIMLKVAIAVTKIRNHLLNHLQADPSLNSVPQPERGGFFSKRDEGKPAAYHSVIGESKQYKQDASNLYR